MYLPPDITPRQLPEADSSFAIDLRCGGKKQSVTAYTKWPKHEWKTDSTETCCPPHQLQAQTLRLRPKFCRYQELGTNLDKPTFRPTKQADLSVCFNGVLGVDKKKITSCRSVFTLRIFKCVEHPCKQLVQIETQHALQDKSTQRTCAPWFVNADHMIRSMVGLVRSAVSNAVLAELKVAGPDEETAMAELFNNAPQSAEDAAAAKATTEKAAGVKAKLDLAQGEVNRITVAKLLPR